MDKKVFAAVVVVVIAAAGFAATSPVDTRVRAVSPAASVCTDTDRATAAHYGAIPGYECLLTSCTDVDGITKPGCEVMHDYLHTGGDVVIYMCIVGYDSPLGEHYVTLSYDRQIVTGNKVALWTRFGTNDEPARILRAAERLNDDWSGVVDLTDHTGYTSVVGTIIAQNDNKREWLVSSAGKAVLVTTDQSSQLLGSDWFGTRYHGETFETPVDPAARSVEASFWLPCYRDQPVWKFYRKCPDVANGEVVYGPCQ